MTEVYRSGFGPQHVEDHLQTLQIICWSVVVCFSSAGITTRRVFKLNVCSRLKTDSADDKLVCSWSVFVKIDLLQICSFRTSKEVRREWKESRAEVNISKNVRWDRSCIFCGFFVFLCVELSTSLLISPSLASAKINLLFFHDWL